MSEKDWITLDERQPENDQPVLASVKNGNTFYHEVLSYNYDKGTWNYNNGSALEEGRKVVGWKESGSTFIG